MEKAVWEWEWAKEPKPGESVKVNGSAASMDIMTGAKIQKRTLMECLTDSK